MRTVRTLHKSLIPVALFLSTVVGLSASAGAAYLPGPTFVDDDGNQHEPNIEAIAAAGITVGCNPPNNDRYCPDLPVTRAQMATFLIRALGESHRLPAYQAYFADVPADRWYAGYVERLYELGITTGKATGNYDPAGLVTRAEMAAFILRALGEASNLAPSRGVFSDVPSTAWYSPSVERLYDLRITVGCSASPLRYCPADYVRRDEMATFLARALKLADVIVVPGTDVQALVDVHPAGTTFVFKPGVHRLVDVVPKDRQVFIGEPGAVLSGARLLDSFVREGGVWIAEGQTQQGSIAGECEQGYSGCVFPEDVFMDDVMLRQVTSFSELRPGAWFFDYGADRIYLADDPTGRKVETSVAPTAFRGGAAGVVVRGLTIEKYANQFGAVGLGGSAWLVEENEVRLNHSIGVHLGEGMLVRNNFLHHNGRLGLGGPGHGSGKGIVVEGNEIAHNNIAGFATNWEAGGAKFVGTDHLVARNNYVHHNHGPGLWTDGGSVSTTYEDNVVVANEGAGIFHEISYGAVIRDNVAEANGFTSLGAGILVSSSPNVEIFGNTVRNNADGITARQEPRGAGTLGPYEIRNLFVHDNLIEMPTGYTGLVQNVGDTSYFDSRNNLFQNNTYRLFDNPTPYRWNNQQLTTQQWVATGNDTSGTWLP